MATEKSQYGDEKIPVDSAQRSIDLAEDQDEFVYEEHQFTWRATIVGSLLGCVVAASNLYLGLKIGWTFGAALWGSIFGFLALKSLSRITNSVFGPKENVVCQSAATTSGGLSSGFVTAIPAMYRMGLMGENRKPEDDVTTLLLWTISAAFFGMFFAIPLRSHFVINQNLVFPTPRAAAETIKNLHRASSSAAKDARDSGWAMGISFLVAMIWAIIAYFIPGIFGSIHILYYIGKAAGSSAIMGADARWGWVFSWDFAFFGAGLMTPGSTVFSFILGELIAFGIAGPLMATNGYLTGKGGFSKLGPSAQSWFLWPGIAMMVVTAFAELGVHYKSLAYGVATAFHELRNAIRKLQKKNAIVSDSDHVSKDPTPPHEMIPTAWWVGGLIVSAIFTVVVMGVNFSIPVYASIGAIILSFLLAFVGLQAAGETDINPTGPVAKVAQLVFSRLPGADIPTLQKTNLMCANMTASICSQSVDMVSDLKTAQLVGASPKALFWAQMVASVFAVGIAIPLFLLYTKAYPCLLIEPVDGAKCQFEAPAVTAWANVCRLLTGEGSIAKEALYFSIAGAILALLNVIIRVKFVPDNWKPYWINLNAVGLGFINTSPAIPVAMLVGYIATNVWKRLSAKSHERLMYSISAGMISGIGIAGLVTAAFTIGGVPEKMVLAGCGDGGVLC
ncbi:MAG: OPT oligopeptide transporter protein-domain-containing protein [Benniella sp.]|nr:MAG: OPT oligopeptide transporter protein-domain-containing protein [Benniella sp.]